MNNPIRLIVTLCLMALPVCSSAYFPPLRDIVVTTEFYSEPDPGETIICSVWDPALGDSVRISYDAPNGFIHDVDVNNGIVVFVEAYSGFPLATYRFVAVVYDPVQQEWKHWRQDATNYRPNNIHNMDGVAFFEQAYGVPGLVTNWATCLTYDPEIGSWTSWNDISGIYTDAAAISYVVVKDGLVTYARWLEWACTGNIGTIICYVIYDPTSHEWVYGDTGIVCDTYDLYIQAATVHVVLENIPTIIGYDRETPLNWGPFYTPQVIRTHLDVSERLFAWFTDMTIGPLPSWMWIFDWSPFEFTTERSFFHEYAGCGQYQVELLGYSVPIDVILDCVTVTVPDQVTTIQAAVDLAVGNDTILIRQGTYTDCSTIDPSSGQLCCFYSDKPLSIRGESGDPADVIINAEYNGLGFVSLLESNPGDDTNRINISGVTLMNGFALGGGASVAANLTLRADLLNIQDCDILGGQSEASSAGGFDLSANEISMSQCKVVGNTGGLTGGGVTNANSISTISDCWFENNNGLYDAGALTCAGSNSAGHFIHGCSFVHNSGEATGALSPWTSVSIENSTFYANHGDSLAADIGILPFPSVIVSVNKSILAYGTGRPAAAVHETSSGLFELSCTDIFGNSEGDWVDPISEQSGVNGNFSLDPEFCFDENPDNPMTLHHSSPCAAENNPECGLIGAHQVACSDSVVAVPQVEVGPSLFLNQCVPNPFNPQTEISFNVPKTSIVSVRIVDIGGRLVKQLFRDVLIEPGWHSIEWDGRSEHGERVPSGVYLYVLECNGKELSQKMTLLK